MTVEGVEGTAVPPTDGVARGRWFETNQFPMVFYAAVALVLWLLVWWSAQNLMRVQPFLSPVPSGGGTWIEGWLRWDAMWYRSIAESGYSYRPGQTSSVAFFPGYPALVRLVGVVARDTYVAGVMVTLVSGATVACLLWRWTGTAAAGAMSALQRRTVVAAVLLWPWAYYLYGAVYADALFVALALGAFLFVERDQVVAAAVVAALAGATRPVGVAVAIGVSLRVVERRGGWRRLRKWADGAVALGFAGVVAFSAYLGREFGDPVAFSTVQAAPGWDQPAGPRTWLKVSLIEELLAPTGRAPTRILVVHAALTIGAIALLPAVWRRFGRAYGAYAAMVVAIPAIGSKDFQGMGRYLLAAFPLFAVAGLQIAGLRPVIRHAILGSSFALLLSFAALFATGHYLA